MSAAKKLNIVDIENGLEELAQKGLSPEEYGRELVSLFGSSATLKRLGTSKANTSEFENGILWREKIHYVPCHPGELNTVIESVKASDKTLKAKVRLIVVNDGSHILVFDRKYNELTDCTIDSIKNEPQLFLPLAGQEGFRREEENEVDIKATGKLAKLYDALVERNPEWLEGDKRHTLNHFMTQIIFCLFAEDTGIFPKDIFTKALKNRAGNDSELATQVIAEIFSTLDVEGSHRDVSRAWLQKFPYVNGGLFKGEAIIPNFTAKAYRYLLEAASLDWKHINPDILGSSIQAIVDPTMRGNLGMHYTSVKNILRTLEPLFLSDLREELFKSRHSKKKINLFLQRLSKIVVFDPACGSGNFLVIAYRELRKLEVQALDALRDIEGGASKGFGFGSVISLSNFYGIEYADFAAETAKLALWIAEYQQNSRFIAAFGADIPALPLKESGRIMCENALRSDWANFCSPLSSHEIFVVSNPPYLGAREMDKKQKSDMEFVFKGLLKGFNNLDYVSAWFLKGYQYCLLKNAKLAFVSTNTLSQGIHINKLWKYILAENVEIGFAYKSFKWTNNAANKAAVTCIIIGLRPKSSDPKYIYEYDGEFREVANINPYLIDMYDVFVEESSKPINGLPSMSFGNMPNDGGNLILSREEAELRVAESKESRKYLRKLIGSSELIKGIYRYCLWIDSDTWESASKIAWINNKVEACRQSRLSSKREATRKLAKSPYRFGEVRQLLKGSTLAVSKVSSENRDYIPADLVDSETIITDLVFGIFDCDFWVLSVVASRLHTIWIRTVCGKLKTDFRYSNTLGWNTFPCPNFTQEQISQLESSARKILLTRENHFPKSIAELYDRRSMPHDLRQAHQENDELLESFYRSDPFDSDEERLAHLFARYAEMKQGSEK